MSDDIKEQLKKIGTEGIHDPKWLADQEQALRAHIKSNPMPTPSTPSAPHLPILAIIAVASILAGIIVFSRPSAPQGIPSPTASPRPSVSESVVPTPTLSPTHTPTSTLTPTPTPTYPRPTVIIDPTPPIEIQ